MLRPCFRVYHAATAAIGLLFSWSPPILFITIFVTVFAVAISITKDMADIEGDRKFKIETFATRLGVKGVSLIGRVVLHVHSTSETSLNSVVIYHYQAHCTPVNSTTTTTTTTT